MVNGHPLDGTEMAANSIADSLPPIAISSYLSKSTAEIRARTIPWEGYQRASLITEEELSQIRQFEKSPTDALQEAGAKYITLFLNLLQKLVRTDTIQNILVLIDDILGDSKTCPIFYSLHDPLLPFSPFLKYAFNNARLLKKDDEYIQLKSAKICVMLLMHAPKDYPFDPADVFAWLTQQLASTNANIVDLAVQYLQSLLSIIEYRPLFYASTAACKSLVDIMKSSTQAQMQYQTVYILWLLTFDKNIAANLQREHDVIPTFLEVAKSAIKEKVVRIIVATIKNMVVAAPNENMVALLGNKALNVCEVLSARNWADEEIKEDLNYLKTELAKIVANLRSVSV